MRFAPAQIEAVKNAAKALLMSAITQTVEEFYGSVLGLNSIQLGAHFPSPDPYGDVAVAVGELTLLREEILRDFTEVPTFVLHDSPMGYCITGLATYYRSVMPAGSYPPDFLVRLEQSASIRGHLLRIDKGQKLEAIAAALLAEICATGEATKGSGDQGIDAIGTSHLIRIDPVFLDGDWDKARVLPGQKVIILASSKANLGAAASGDVSTISPAHIREIVGGWMIQRSESSMWRHHGIQMLTPLQLLLVTTYRLSSDSKSLCNQLGVQVWGIPELTFLLCKHAPAMIFSTSAGFSDNEFEKWWKLKDGTRVFPKAA